MKIMIATLNKSRPSVGAQALGIASAALEDSDIIGGELCPVPHSVSSRAAVRNTPESLQETHFNCRFSHRDGRRRHVDGRVRKYCTTMLPVRHKIAPLPMCVAAAQTLKVSSSHKLFFFVVMLRA